jgi:hypothetical protein
LVNTVVSIELTNQDNINDDFAVELLEQISSDLQSLSDKEKTIIIKQIELLSTSYPPDVGNFVKLLPQNLGIEISSN